MKIALAQMNPTLGDFPGNAAKIINYSKEAKALGAELVVFPEASLFGYHPVDLLERKSVVDEQIKYISKITKALPKDLLVLIGAITLNKKVTGKPFYNSALLLQSGKPARTFNKELLPTYDVFDEARHIEAGDLQKNTFKFKGKRILVTICEDIWAWDFPGTDRNKYSVNPIKKIKSKDIDFILNLSASPFTDKKFKQRDYVTKSVVKHLKAPMVYVNMIGAQDELIFDGASFALDATGKKIAQMSRFEEELMLVDFDNLKKQNIKKIHNKKIYAQHRAIVLGIKDFVGKIGINKVHLGLSGGVDSAVIAVLATEALGAENVTAIAMPSQFNDKRSLSESEKLARNIGIELITVPIQEMYEYSLKSIEPIFKVTEFGLMHENLQARIRANILMAYSNQNGSLLLNTSNKSELAMGYSTLYGDLCGGLSPMGDLLKTDVYKMAEYLNSEKEVIPSFIITRPASAELRPNQTDQDSLPEYEVLDRSIDKLVNKCQKPSGEVDKLILLTLMKTEFKRWQSPPVLKVTDHAFGRGRRLPIAHRASY